MDSLRASEERLRAFMEHSPLVAFMKDARGRYVYINARMEEAFGIAADRICGTADVDWLPERIASTVRENDRTVLATGQTLEVVESIPGPDGTEHQWLVNKFLFTNGTGEHFVGGVAMDITSLKRVEALLRHGEERYRVLIENSQGLICTHDLAGTILSINPAALRALDHCAGEVVGRNLKDFLLPEVRDQFARYLERVAQTGQDLGLMVVVTKSGQPRTWQYHNVLTRDAADHMYVLGHAQDVTELRQAQERLRTLAVTDDLTGLLNRRGFFTRAARILQNLAASGSSATVFYVDIVGLKQINDTYGHDRGSAMIVAAAEALSQTFRAADVVARLGGDEFVVLAQLPDHATPMVMRRLATHVRLINNRTQSAVRLALSVGSSHLAKGQSETLEELIRLADADMYARRRHARRRVPSSKPTK